MNQVNQLPRFAVFLAAFNGMQYIADQLQSILSQKNVSIQIFISVDQSSDGTEDFLINFSSNDARITLLPLGHQFGGASPNFYRLIQDIDLSDFDYVSFSDQDDIWYPNKLFRAHYFLSQGKADGYSSNVNAFWPSGRLQLIDKAQPQKPWDFLFEAAGPGCTYVLTMRLALPLQLLIRNYKSSVLEIAYHDWLIYSFARINKFVWTIDSWPSMRYRQHQNNQVGVNIGWRPFLIRARKMLNGHGFNQSLLIVDLLGASSAGVIRYGLRGGRFGYLWLALHAKQCRRKSVDQLVFFLLCLISFALNPMGRGKA